MRGPIDSPVMREFADGFDPVNSLADRAPGFVWRLQTGGHAPLVEDDGGLWVVNVSLWRSYEALHDFVYRSPHAAYLRRRSRWFHPAAPPRPPAALPPPPPPADDRPVVGGRRRAPGRRDRPGPAGPPAPLRADAAGVLGQAAFRRGRGPRAADPGRGPQRLSRRVRARLARQPAAT